MAPPALSLPLNAIRNLLSTKHGEALIVPLFAIAFLFAMVWDDFETSFSAAIASIHTDANAGAIVLSFTHAGSSAMGDSELVFLVDINADRETCELESAVALSRLNPAAVRDNATTYLVPLRANPTARELADIIFAKLGDNGTNLISHARKDML